MTLPAKTILRHIGHRQRPLPRGPWLGRQSWIHLLLAHWQVAPETLQAHLPDGLHIDTTVANGHEVAWLSIVTYRMANVGLRGMPAFMGLYFPQLNLRTYVTYRGEPGIYFFSLDASSPLAVRAGSLITGLPYFRAEMTHQRRAQGFAAASRRCQNAAIGFAANYRPLPAVRKAESVDAWLTERYVFYAEQTGGRLTAGDVCHAP